MAFQQEQRRVSRLAHYWCDETVQLKFGIEMLKANTRSQEGIEVDIKDILRVCNQPKLIAI
ncbi:hypothetical protein RDI58_007118 [Solanum bulbocastanum]|uniref:Uncharacterized protein n=1 Tax=Solanum bulbocastanum TaxID=147425 RepID=A0AAN8TUM5_SOLBU